MRVQYIAKDNQVFYTQEACEKHEAYLDSKKKKADALAYIEQHKLGTMNELTSWLDYCSDWWTAYLIYMTPEMKEAVDTLDPYGSPCVGEKCVVVISGDDSEAACYELSPIYEEMKETLKNLELIIK